MSGVFVLLLKKENILFLTIFKLLSIYICLVHRYSQKKAMRKKFLLRTTFLAFFFPHFSLPNVSTPFSTFCVSLSFLWHFQKNFHLCLLLNHLAHHESLAYIINVEKSMLDSFYVTWCKQDQKSKISPFHCPDSHYSQWRGSGTFRK